MKKSIFLSVLSVFIAFTHNAHGQTIGTKKEAILFLKSYLCTEDDCYIEFKDIKTGKVYTFFNVDEKTKDHGILEEIQDKYYKNNNDDIGSRGQKFYAALEYRKTDEYKSYPGSDAPPYRTGKRIALWMINELRKLK